MTFTLRHQLKSLGLFLKAKGLAEACLSHLRLQLVAFLTPPETDVKSLLQANSEGDTFHGASYCS